MKMTRWMRALLGLGVVVVVALLGLNIYMACKPAPAPAITLPLAQLLPPAPSGWTPQDLPLASTPEEQEQVEGILHYDDAVYRTYDNGRTQIGVYIAHWLPGKFSPEKVGSHSPDTCWIHNGWERIAPKQFVEQPLAGGKLKTLTAGAFEKDHEKVYVIFWHLVGGVPMHYDLEGWDNGLAGRIERLPALVADFKQFGLDQRKEQVVIRISANQPFDQLWSNPSFVQLMDQLSRNFGLYAELPPAPGNKAQAAMASLHPKVMGTL